MIILYILKVMVISWGVGHASALLLKSVIPLNKLPSFNFIRNEEFNRLIGVGIVKWVLVNSFIKYFNPKLQMSDKKPSLETLIELRGNMTYAEIVHLIGFAFVMLWIVVNLINGERHGMIAPLIAMNIILNFYPTLVQQANKRRIDCILKSLDRRQVT